MKRKKIISIIAIILALMMFLPLLLSAFSMTASAVSSSELKRQLGTLQDEADNIASEAAKLQTEIDGNQSSTKSTVDQKGLIDQKIEITRQEINNTNDQIQQYNLLIAAKQEELDQAQANETEMQSRFRSRIRAMEEGGAVSYWSVLFNASNFTDLLDRIDMIHEISQSDERMMEQLAAATAQVTAARQNLEAEKEELETAKQTLATQQSTLESERAEADTLLVKLAAESEELNELLAKKNAEGDELDEKIADKLAQYEKVLADEAASRKAAAAATTNKGSGQSSSGFQYPLPSGSAYVSCAYGYRYHPIYGYYAMHYGVDLAAASGTPIYAIKSGTVSTATYGTANGNYVAINHGDGSSSIYAHMTYYTVAVGQSVSKGEVIGYVGSTGWATGAHLHFEILINGSNVNPMDYVSG
ncbi:MAG: peptidoglycan DD-metalloendopeptidase family protein [Oscillospiraceae bacterium]|nr:peptidoglycan DD-metalloendopeptidase family protein [Oscillospiraceae bacterium]